MKDEQLRAAKILAGQFFEEMKSTNLTDFITWLDCKQEYYKHNREQMKRVVDK